MGGYGQLIAMVIGEEQLLQQLENDVGPVLASADSTTTTMYVISLGELCTYIVVGVAYGCGFLQVY